MSVTIHLPSSLRSHFGERDRIHVEMEGTVGDLLRRVTEGKGDLQHQIFNEKGEIRNFMNVYLNEEDIRFIQGSDTTVKRGDEIYIVASIAGG